MITPELTSGERREMLREITAARREVDRLVQRGESTPAKAAAARCEGLENQFLERLPVVAFSACPFTGKVLYRAFDPFGFDSPYWTQGVRRTGPPAPETFAVLRGAVALGSARVSAATLAVHLGPEVPYVVPRLLGLEGMVAVVGQLEVAPRIRVFTIGYFAPQRPRVADLAYDWPETVYSWRTLFGERGSRTGQETWDFELKPWIAKGKVRWCVPGSGNEKVAPPAPKSITGAQECPYLDLKGRREHLMVKGDKVWNRGLPNGDPITAADLLD